MASQVYSPADRKSSTSATLLYQMSHVQRPSPLMTDTAVIVVRHTGTDGVMGVYLDHTFDSKLPPPAEMTEHERHAYLLQRKTFAQYCHPNSTGTPSAGDLMKYATIKEIDRWNKLSTRDG